MGRLDDPFGANASRSTPELGVTGSNPVGRCGGYSSMVEHQYKDFDILSLLFLVFVGKSRCSKRKFRAWEIPKI